MWDFKGIGQGKSGPCGCILWGRFYSPSAPTPAPLPPLSNPEQQHPPCQETLSHPLTHNYLLPLNSLHLRGEGGKGVTQ